MSNKRPSYSNYENRGGKSSQSRNSSIDEVIKIIENCGQLSEISIEDIAKPDGIAYRVVENLKDIKTTQLRKYFDTIVKIDERIKDSSWAEVQTDFFMLYPMLAYALGRKTIPKGFCQLCKACLDKIPAEDENIAKKNFRRFKELMESVVAYSKSKGERR